MRQKKQKATGADDGIIVRERKKQQVDAAVSAEAKSKKQKKVKSPRGPKKEKTQISVRIDKIVMDLAYELIEEKKGRIRITDLLERGLMLAMHEERKSTTLARQARFVVAEANAKQQHRMMKIVGLDLLPRQRPLTPLETVLREFFLTGLDTVDTWEGYPECFELLGQPDVVMELKALPAATP